jgi:methyl coenzyme M reductase subunit D
MIKKIIMKTNNILLILIILTFAGATWLITENHALKNREIDMMDKWFNMEEDLGNMQVEIFDMKTQMNRIESLIDEMAIDYSDTNTVNYN